MDCDWSLSVQKETVRWLQGAYIARRSASPHPVGLRRDANMKKFLTESRKWFVRAALTAVAAGGFLLLGAAPPAAADDDACQHRLAKADHRVHEAAEHHGWNSSQANNARHQLNE